ncbi:MAG TPA: PAS domain-containing protein [Flavobacterium sp.]|jgi:signal transduction histidine kinase
MDAIIVKPEKFNFKHLPEYAAFVLREKLAEYSNSALRFSREEDLPLLKPLSKFSDSDLMAISIESSRVILEALAGNRIHLHIQQSVNKWITNQLEVIDKDEVVAEDITLVAFIRRKALSCFISDYTDDHELKKKLIREIDTFTTREELVSYNAYIKMQQEKLNKTNEDLAFQESLLLEAQEISELGSFFMDYVNPELSIVTPQMSKITGLPDFHAPEIFFMHIHPEDAPVAKEAWEKAYSEGGTFDYSCRFINNGIEKVLHSRGIVKKENGKAVNLRGTIKDVTKEHRLIRKLTDSEALNKLAQQLTHIGNWAWQIGTGIVEWSDEMYRIYGLEPQSETITLEKFLSLVHPDDREKRMAEIQEAVQTGVVKEYTLRAVNPDGTIKILRGHGSIETNALNEPVRMIGTCQDITREYYLNRELVALNNSLSLKNKELVSINRELESFNYVASHDLQEPLRKIMIYSDRLTEQAETLPQDARKSLDKVTSSAARMQRLISDLIEFSQLSSPSGAFTNVSINDILEDVKSNFSDQMEEYNAKIEVAQFPVIQAVPFQLTQLFTNIIGNALKYRKPNVSPVIKINWDILPAEERSENFFRISICDNGIGFESSQKENIFDLFRRLHANERYSGTGIGLAICKKIVTNHNGFIIAESEPGQGACFQIYLPESRLMK